MSEQREAIARAIYPHGFIDSSREFTTERVIAHLWNRADDPEVVEAVKLEIAGGNEHIYGLFDGEAVELIARILTALLGPRPNGEGASDER